MFLNKFFLSSLCCYLLLTLQFKKAMECSLYNFFAYVMSLTASTGNISTAIGKARTPACKCFELKVCMCFTRTFFSEKGRVPRLELLDQV